MFQNASSLKPLGQLKPNCPGMIIGRSSTNFLFFYVDRKFKMATNYQQYFTYIMAVSFIGGGNREYHEKTINYEI
jgi:hypothetical protein